MTSFLNEATVDRLLTVPLAAALFLALATPAWPDPPPPRLGPGVSSLRATPIAFDREAPGRDRAGALRFLGGWSLASDDARFGGISAMHIEDGWATAVSDVGSLIRFRMPDAADAGRVRIAPIAEGPAPGRRKSDRDAEALLLFAGRAWIVFESPRQVWRYGSASWRAEAWAAPAAMQRWRSNQGGEALVRFADGRFLILSEMPSRAPGLSRALLFSADPATSGALVASLSYRPPEGFVATDAAFLPDGRLLVLNRRATWLEGVAAALVVIDPATIRPGAVIAGREIARLEWPLVVDNMEALGVTSEGGRTIVWLASDDNFNPIQRTLLLKFELTE